MAAIGSLTEDWRVSRAGARVRALPYVLIAASAVAVWLAGQYLLVIPFGRAIWDYLFLLDGAYRISLGQLPHQDFQSPIGSLSLYLTAWAQQMFPAGNPFVGLHALAWIMVLLPLGLLAPKFRSTGPFAAAMALLALMVLVPVTLDSTHLSEISYFASYNRFATGLLFLAGLWFVLPKGRLDGILLAYILIVLFFLKITAALVVLGIIAAAFVLGRTNARTSLLAVLLAAIGIAIVEVTTGLVSAYLASTLAMTSINTGRATYLLFFAAFRNWLPLVAVAAITVVGGWAFVRSGELDLGRPIRSLRAALNQQAFAVDALLLVAAALFAESQNTGGLGLIAASALLFHADAWTADRLRGYGAALLAATLILPVADVVVTRAATAYIRERNAVADPKVAELLPGTRVPVATEAGAALFGEMTSNLMGPARLAATSGFFVDPDPTSYSVAARLAWVNGAVDAAHAFEAAGFRELAQSYATLSFADPFMRMLHLVPAKGTTIVTEVGRTMPLLDVAGASRYLSTSDGVFVPRCEVGGGEGNEAAFEVVLQRQFERKPLTKCWDFYHRVAPAKV